MAHTISNWTASVLLKLGHLQLAETRGKRFLKLAAEARAGIEEITVAEVAQAVRRGVLVIDVREREEYHRTHIPLAVHVSRGTLELEIERHATESETEIVVYCGAGNRSALAAATLQRMGYTNVKWMAGGLQGWLAAGLPASRGNTFLEED